MTQEKIDELLAALDIYLVSTATEHDCWGLPLEDVVHQQSLRTIVDNWLNQSQEPS